MTVCRCILNTKIILGKLIPLHVYGDTVVVRLSRSVYPITVVVAKFLLNCGELKCRKQVRSSVVLADLNFDIIHIAEGK